MISHNSDDSPQYASISPESGHSLGAPPSHPSTQESPVITPNSHAGSSRVKKRTLNTLAARRYRQKRVDQVSGLESALKETELERDALKVRVARLEGELEVLRGLVRPGR